MAGIIAEKSLKIVIAEKHNQIKKIYLNDNRPWVIGYSGGKDSTTTLQLIFNSLKELPPNELIKPVYVISSNTYIENPIILKYIEENLNKINKTAEDLHLPITAQIVLPKNSQTFWTLLIGKGYPTPRQTFRWCTDRLKINPANDFIINKVNEFGEAIVVLGVRRSESSSRASVMDAHKIEGKLLRHHSSLNNAYVYAPIEDFDTDDVWTYLTAVENPWNSDNSDLLALYQSSSDTAECPLVIDKSSPSCGNSRFGCWACTVVVEDKSLTGFIKTAGEKWLVPLLKFRDTLKNMRDLPENRETKRMNGSIYHVKTKDGYKRGLGPFTLDARKKMLIELLEREKEINNLKQMHDKNKGIKNTAYIELIQEFELKQIRNIWLENGDWEDSLPFICRKYSAKNIEFDHNERPLFSTEEIALLDDICLEEDVSSSLMKKLINVEISYYGFKNRTGILKNLDTILKQDWVHEEILEDPSDVNDEFELEEGANEDVN